VLNVLSLLANAERTTGRLSNQSSDTVFVKLVEEKALAETAALLVLRKKANAIWGEAEDE
jgi:hypothetical protein